MFVITSLFTSNIKTNATILNTTKKNKSIYSFEKNTNLKYYKASKKNPKNISNSGIKLIKRFESFHKSKYRSLDNGNWTIGYGHVIRSGEKFGKTISKKDATKLLKKDLKECIKPTREYLDNVVGIVVEQYQFDALISLAFNTGTGTLSEERSPNLTNLLRNGQWTKKELVNEFGTYCGYHDKNGNYLHSRGIWRRHIAEGLLYVSGKYKVYSFKELKRKGYKYPYN